MLKYKNIVTLLVLSMLAGCGQNPDPGSGAREKIYKHAMDGAPETICPAGTSFPVSSQMRTAVEQIGRPAEPVRS